MDPLGKVPCLQVCCCKQSVMRFGFLHTAVSALPGAEEASPEQKPEAMFCLETARASSW